MVAKLNNSTISSSQEIKPEPKFNDNSFTTKNP